MYPIKAFLNAQLCCFARAVPLSQVSTIVVLEVMRCDVCCIGYVGYATLEIMYVHKLKESFTE